MQVYNISYTNTELTVPTIVSLPKCMGKNHKLAVVVFFFYLALIKQGGREGARRVSIVGTSYIQFILLSIAQHSLNGQ